MKAVYVVHYNEIALKGQNRPMFLRQLQENIARSAGLKKKDVKIVPGRILVYASSMSLRAKRSEAKQSHTDGVGSPRRLTAPRDDIKWALSRTFGISSFSSAVLVRAEYAEIERGVEVVISGGRTSGPPEERSLRFDTFAISAARGDKQFSMTSKDLEVKLGDVVRKKFNKKVNLENPDITFYVEVFEDGAVVYTEKIPGAGGLPVGVAAKTAVLLSGGIDSPVAAYRIMKRGAPIVAVHFHSYPFASRASIDKVKEVVKMLEQYHGGRPIPLYAVPLAEAQKQVVQKCAEHYRVLLYRRLMWRIAAEIANREGAQALTTGESLGQVASQTIENMAAVEAVVRMPIFRPLIGFDKQEIINESKHIGTYEISIQPHDDCCTLFIPKQVATRALAEKLDVEERKLSIGTLTDNALAKMEHL